MYLLDTDICSYLIRSRPLSVLENFNRVERSELNISVITEAEMRYGVLKNRNVKVTTQVVEKFLGNFAVLEWDSLAARHYADLRVYLESAGTPIGNMDAMIAAHALSLRAVLVTNNLRHFARVPGLKTVSWV